MPLNSADRVLEWSNPDPSLIVFQPLSILAVFGRPHVLSFYLLSRTNSSAILCASEGHSFDFVVLELVRNKYAHWWVRYEYGTNLAD